MTHQYKSDKLQKEIIKNLSLKDTNKPTTAELGSKWQDNYFYIFK